MASSSIVADISGLIQACFITNLDWYDISNKLRLRNINIVIIEFFLVDSLTVWSQQQGPQGADRSPSECPT